MTNSWWRRPRKNEMPPEGAEILVVLDRAVFGGIEPIKAVVRVIRGTWRAYDMSGYNGDAPLPIDFAIHKEGVDWALGWDSDEAKALLVAQALV